jgi:hypothetical protein
MRFVEQELHTQPDLDGPALVERIQRELGLTVHRRTVERALVRSKKKRR